MPSKPSQHDLDLDRIKPFRKFFRAILARIRPEANEIRDRLRLDVENIEAMDFRPMICIDWVKVSDELLFINDLFPNDMEIGEETNTLLKVIDDYAYMIHDDETTFFTINSMGIAELTDGEKEVLQKILRPDDAF